MPGWPCWLNTRQLGAATIAQAVALGCVGISVGGRGRHDPRVPGGRGGRPRGRGLDRHPADDLPAPGGARRRRHLRRGRGAHGLTRAARVAGPRPTVPPTACLGPRAGTRRRAVRAGSYPRADRRAERRRHGSTRTSRCRGRRGRHDRRLGGHLPGRGRCRTGRRRRARSGGSGREQPGGGHRPGAGRHACDGRTRPLGDRLLQRPAGPLRDRLRVPRARLPDHRDHRPRRTRGPGPGRDAASRRARRPLAQRSRGLCGEPDAQPRRAPGRELHRDRRRDRSAAQRPGLLARDAASRGRAARADGADRRPDRARSRRRGRHDRRPDRYPSGPADRWPVAPRGRPSGRSPDPGWRRPPPGRRHSAPSGVHGRAAADGVRPGPWALLAARGGRAPVRDEQPRGATRTRPRDRLAVPASDASPARCPRPCRARSRPAPRLGGDDRLHAGPSADPRTGDHAGRRTGSTDCGSPRRAATG